MSPNTLCGNSRVALSIWLLYNSSNTLEVTFTPQGMLDDCLWLALNLIHPAQMPVQVALRFTCRIWENNFLQSLRCGWPAQVGLAMSWAQYGQLPYPDHSHHAQLVLPPIPR